MIEKYKFMQGCISSQKGWPNLLLVAHKAGRERFGGEHSFVDLLRGMSKLNINLYASLPDAPTDYANQVSSYVCGIFVFAYPQWQSNNPVDQKAVSIISEILNVHNIHLIHVNTIMLREPLIAARRCGVASAVHVRELIDRDPDLAGFIGLSPERIIAQVIKSSCYIIGNSKTTASTFPKPEKTFILPNTVDIEAFDICNEIKDKIRVAMVSSNIPKKGIRDFVTLANECSKQNIKARFILVGPYNKYIEALFSKKMFGAIPNNLYYGGYYNNPVQAVSMGNIIVNFSSFAESFGRTVLEAMASRRPVIAYNWGALPELIQDGLTGYLVPYKDISAAVPIIKNLSKNYGLIQRLGEQAREVAAARYNQDIFTSEMARIYSTILKTNVSACSGEGFKTSTDDHNMALPGAACEGYIGSSGQTLPKERPGISIIILNRNGAAYLDRLLETFTWNNTYQPVELIIVDHASTDRTGEVIEKWSKRLPIKFLKRDRNYTFSASNNYGVEKAIYPYLLFLNNDIVYTTDILPLAAAQLEDSRIGAVGVRLDDDCASLSAGELPSVQHVGIKFAWVEQLLFYKPYQLRLRSPAEAKNVPSGLYPAVTGAFLLCRKDDFFAVGGFYEEYDYNFEDVDFCLQLWFKLKKRCLCINEYSLQHVEKATRNKASTKVRAKRESNNLRVLKRRTANYDLSSEGLRAEYELKCKQSRSDTVTIIVPVYNALEEVITCLDSLVRNTQGADRIIIIDDCSPDPDVWPELARFEKEHSLLYCMRNKRNMGYTATVNKGMQMVEGDVILINSDIVVTKNWLAKMREAAVSRENVATVTPLSNAAGAFSLPENNINNPIPEGMTIEQMARLVEDESSRIRPVVPTGNGFCMYIRREAIDAVGLFDEEGFPRGYGEENDFCQRAIREGFVNIIDDATFIYHKRTASFKESKDAILTESARLIQQRWPGYRKDVSEWLSNDPLTPFREHLKSIIAGTQKIQLQHLSFQERTLKILYVNHPWNGGMLLTNRDLLKYVSRLHCCYLLVTDLTGWKLYHWCDGQANLQKKYKFIDKWQIDKPLSGERLAALKDICRHISPDLVHIRHMIANHPDIIKVFKSFHLPVIISFHDFYTLCPTIHLIDSSLDYCEGFCRAPKKQCQADAYWFEHIPPLEGQFVQRWRDTVASALALGDAYVVTSSTTREVMQKHYSFFEDAKVHIIEHGRDMRLYPWVSHPPSNNEPVRLLFFGSLGRNKGVKLIKDMLEMNDRRGIKLDIHILGKADLRFNPANYENCTYHGSYQREELPGLLAKLNPSLALVPSIWPETFCHILTEAWAAGVPVLGSNLGAVGERISRMGGGWALDPRDAAAWVDKIVEIARSPVEYEDMRNQIRKMSFKSTADMAKDYIGLYYEVLANNNPILSEARQLD